MGDFFGPGGGGLSGVGSFGGSDPGGGNFTDPMSGGGMPGPGGGSDMGFGGPPANAWDTGLGAGTSSANVFTPGSGQATAATTAQAQQTAPPPPPGGGTPTGQPSGQSDLMSQIAKILGVNQANAAGGTRSPDAAFGGPPAGTQTTTAPSAPQAAGTPAVDDLGRPIPGTGATGATPPAQAAVSPGGGVPPAPNPAAQTGITATPVKTTAVTPDQAPTQPIPGSQPTGPQATTGTTGTTTGTTTAAPDPATGGAPVSPGQAGQGDQGFNPMRGILNLIGNLFGAGNLGDLLMGQGNQDWMSNAGQPGDPWYQKPLAPGYGPDPLKTPTTTIPPQSPPVSGKPQDPAAQGVQPAGPGASNQPTFPNLVPRGGQPSAAGIPTPQGGPLAGAPVGTPGQGTGPLIANREYRAAGRFKPPGQPAQSSVDVSPLAREADNEALMRRSAAMGLQEVGRTQRAQIMQLETARNRALYGIQGKGKFPDGSWAPQSMQQALARVQRGRDGRYHSIDGVPGYYPNYGNGANLSPKYMQWYKQNVWDPVMRQGVNMSDVGWGPMTGNASAGVARNQYAKGQLGYDATPMHGDQYFREHVGDQRNLLPTMPGSQPAAAATPAAPAAASAGRGPGAIGNVVSPVLARLRGNQAATGPQGGPLAGRPEQPTRSDAEFGGPPNADATGRTRPWWDTGAGAPGRRMGAGPTPEETGQLTGTHPLPEIEVKPETAKAGETDKSKPAPSKTKPKPGMTRTQRRALKSRGTSPPPPVPKLSPYGSTSDEYERSKRSGYVQPGESGYDRSMRYYYGR